jgi:flagellar hook-associated protein 1 FlgK
MRSTFMGLETAKRGMFTQQSALYTTGHNISNANTPGYSRQRINFQSTEPYPAVGLNRPHIPGQMGTGVEAGSVQRIRDSFIDQQYRTENNKLGYWSAKADALSKVEDIVNEPSTEGLSAALTEMWGSLQVLAGSSENEGARGVVLERVQAVTDTFNYMSDSLNSIKEDFGNQVEVTVDAANSVIKQLFDVNRQIGEIEPNGYLPNDLYDRRDALVDELSQYMNISIKQVETGGNSLDIAEGIYEITLLNDNGTSGPLLIDQHNFKQMNFDNSTTMNKKISTDFVESLYLVDHGTDGKPVSSSTPYTVDFADSGAVVFSKGEIRGLIEAFGYKEDGASAGEPVKGTYSEMLNELDELAYSLGAIFNEIHAKGVDLDGVAGKVLFNGLDAASHVGAAGTIKLNTDVAMREIAAAMSNNDGDGRNALNLANIGSMDLTMGVKTLLGDGTPVPSITLGTAITQLNLPIKSGTLNSFYESIIGRLGVDSKQAGRMEGNIEVLRSSVVTNRESISSVSLDEEMTNLIKFQHAYNGAARMITVVDEMLDKIINGMGVVGR